MRTSTIISFLCSLAVAMIASAPLALTAPPSATAQLFNGKDLAGWVGDTDGYRVEDGAIVCTDKGGNLFSAKEYGDFECTFEFRLTAGANNGIAIRSPLEGDPAYAGFEVQVLDNSSPQYATLKPYQYHGSVYGIAAAKREGMKPIGEWNTETIAFRGTKIKVTLNDVVILDVDLAVVAKDGKTIDGQPHAGLTRTKGHFGLCGHGDSVAFRNIRMTAL